MLHRWRSDLAGRAVVLKVDTEEYPQLAARYKVQGIPNFAVFANGELSSSRPVSWMRTR